MTRSFSRFALAASASFALALSACGDARVSDASISETIAAKLDAEPDLAVYDLDVDTQKGVVTLAGSVAAPSQRSEAERIALSTTGVQSVRNQIEIASQVAPAPPDVGAPGAEIPRDPDTE